MSTHDTPLCTCPACGKRFNAATNAEPWVAAPPMPGDLSICVGCERVLVFTTDGTRRRATPAEEQEHATLIDFARNALRTIKQERRET